MGSIPEVADVPCPRCGRVLWKRDGDGVTRIRGKLWLAKNGHVFAVCEDCNAEMDITPPLRCYLRLPLPLACCAIDPCPRDSLA